MRGSKFRVWCLDKKAWEDDKTFLTPNGRLFRKFKWDVIWRDVTETHIVEWYTGLKDKNHVEVYEGDKYLNEQTGYVGEFFYNQTSTGGYELWCKENRPNGQVYNYCPFSELNLRNFEVIGNIHEESNKMNEGLEAFEYIQTVTKLDTNISRTDMNHKEFKKHIDKKIILIRKSLGKVDKLNAIKDIVKFGMEGNPSVPQIYVREINKVLSEDSDKGVK